MSFRRLGKKGEKQEGMQVLETRGLHKSFYRRKVVDDVSLIVRRGEVVGLLGPNGAGKTTTFYMIVGLLSPDRGMILTDNENISDLPMYKRARKGISYLPQEPSIFRKLTVEDNLMAILETMDLTFSEMREKMKALVKEMGILHLLKNKAYTLSGGERRRVEISRALITSPNFLLLDEPFTGIDPIAIADIQSIISQLKEKGIGILITDHNVRETLEITDRSYILYDGKILVSGTSSELAVNEKAKEIYLGKDFTLH